jgi:uncharacterized delta-60 repeat protein
VVPLRRLLAGPRRLTLGLLAAGPALAAPGDLDPTFGSGGKSLVFPGATGEAVALAPDGAVAVAGRSGSAGFLDFAVARLGSNGRLDPAFGANGTAVVPVGGGDDSGRAVVAMPDGRLVVAGASVVAGLSEFGIVRLAPGGSLDGTFGLGGRFFTDFGGGAAGRALALAPDGRLVAAGSAAGEFAVTRLVSTGSSDPGFGIGGRSLADLGGVDEADAVALAPEGSVVVAGTSNDNFAVTRLQPNGYFDMGFGVAGRSHADFGGADFGRAVAVAPDGKIVVAGHSIVGGDSDIVVARLRSNGYFDTSFAAGGRSRVDLDDFDFGWGVALAPDGKIVVAGYTGNRDVVVARLQPNGSPGTTFGGDGSVTVDFGGLDSGKAVALAPDGKIVVAGSSNRAGISHIAVARLLGDAAPAGAGAGGGAAGSGSASRRAGARATIIGTRAADRLKGTPRRDVIAGLGGADTIRALGGADLVCGGPGRDRLLGGPGLDRILGGPGIDRLLGGAGRDRLLGGPGRDRLVGGAGRDLERP